MHHHCPNRRRHRPWSWLRAAALVCGLFSVAPALLAQVPAPVAAASAPMPAPMPAPPPMLGTSSSLVKVPDGRMLAPDIARIVMRGELVVAMLGVDTPPFSSKKTGNWSAWKSTWPRQSPKSWA